MGEEYQYVRDNFDSVRFTALYRQLDVSGKQEASGIASADEAVITAVKDIIQLCDVAKVSECTGKELTMKKIKDMEARLEKPISVIEKKVMKKRKGTSEIWRRVEKALGVVGLAFKNSNRRKRREDKFILQQKITREGVNVVHLAKLFQPI